MVHELSDENKLKVINKILAKWTTSPTENYICNEIVLNIIGIIGDHNKNTDIAIKLIPELLIIKPNNVDLYNIEGWFGPPVICSMVRRNVLLQLRRIIEYNIKTKSNNK
jgi:hypothetical protein